MVNGTDSIRPPAVRGGRFTPQLGKHKRADGMTATAPQHLNLGRSWYSNRWTKSPRWCSAQRPVGVRIWHTPGGWLQHWGSPLPWWCLSPPRPPHNRADSCRRSLTDTSKLGANQVCPCNQAEGYLTCRRQNLASTPQNEVRKGD